MYFIEIFQAFTGRLPEVDDLIANIAGFLVGYLTAQGFLELFDEKAYKYGIIRILSTVILFCISIFALSFWANGDALQAEEEAYVKMMEQYGMEHRQEKQKIAQKKCDRRKDQAVSISLLEQIWFIFALPQTRETKTAFGIGPTLVIKIQQGFHAMHESLPQGRAVFGATAP